MTGTTSEWADGAVRIERHDRIAVVYFDRGDRSNALSLDQCRRLTQAARGLETDPDLAAVILTGSASVFTMGADLKDPALDPLASKAMLAKFPPTLLMTGTRAGDMSRLIYSHRALVKAGVDARMVLWDGLDHCFMSEAELPEAREAVEIATKFFAEAMDKAKP